MRISDHDLPAGYYGRNGMSSDFDVMAGERRSGTDGEAEDYETFLERILTRNGGEVAKSWQAVKKENEEKLAEQKYEAEKASYEKNYKAAYEKALSENPELAKNLAEAERKLAEKREGGLSSKKAKSYRHNVSLAKRDIESKMRENGFIFKT